MAPISIFKLQKCNATEFFSTFSTHIFISHLNKDDFTHIFNNIVYFEIAVLSYFYLEIHFRVVKCYFVQCHLMFSAQVF